jgi:hypothetical protein
VLFAAASTSENSASVSRVAMDLERKFSLVGAGDGADGMAKCGGHQKKPQRQAPFLAFYAPFIDRAHSAIVSTTAFDRRCLRSAAHMHRTQLSVFTHGNAKDQVNENMQVNKFASR